MKKIPLTVVAVALMFQLASAQSPQAQFEASLPDSVKYVMPSFGSGSILYKDGGYSRGSFNISTLDNTLRYLDTDGSEKSLANLSEVESVSISNVLFLHVQDMFLGVASSYGDVLLCVEKQMVFDDRKTGAYGTSSATTSIRSVGSSTDNGATFRFSNVKYELKETPYFYKKGRLMAPTKRSLLKLFPDKKDAIEAYLQENKLDYSSYAALQTLLDTVEQ